MLAPIGSIETFAPGGGATAAQASAEFGIPQMLSSVCAPGLEAVAAAADNFRIFQLYVRGDDALDDHVRRAVAHGYAAFCLTVDTAVYSRRATGLGPGRFVKPWRVRAGGFQYQSGLSWDHVKRFKDTHGIPLILKASPPRRMPPWRATTAWRSSTSPTTAGASSPWAGHARRPARGRARGGRARPRHRGRWLHARDRCGQGHRAGRRHGRHRPPHRLRPRRRGGPGPGAGRSSCWRTRSASAWG